MKPTIIRDLIASPYFVVGATLAACLIPLVTDNYAQYMINLAIAFVLAAMGQQIVLGFAGQFAFHNAILMGLGAYVVAILTHRVGVNSFIALPIAGLVAGAIGALTVLPAIRMSHAYLGVTTLGFAELGRWILLNWRSVTLGTDGIRVPAPRLLDQSFAGDKSIFYVVLFMTLLLLLLVKRMLWSRLGRAFCIIKENETVAACHGINVPLYKTFAFALGGFCAGCGGGLYAITVGFIIPDSFGILMLVLHFTIVVIGGIGTFSGAIIGALGLTILPELLRDFRAYQEMLYGLLLILFVMFWPRGVAGLLIRHNVLPREILVHRWRCNFTWRDTIDEERKIDRFAVDDRKEPQAADARISGVTEP
jgi:branched-chain amino acid transport system permease protein